MLHKAFPEINKEVEVNQYNQGISETGKDPGYEVEESRQCQPSLTGYTWTTQLFHSFSWSEKEMFSSTPSEIGQWLLFTQRYTHCSMFVLRYAQYNV